MEEEELKRGNIGLAPAKKRTGVKEEVVEQKQEMQEEKQAMDETKITKINNIKLKELNDERTSEVKLLSKRKHSESSSILEKKVSKKVNKKVRSSLAVPEVVSSALEIPFLAESQTEFVFSYNLRRSVGIERDQNFVYERPIKLKAS